MPFPDTISLAMVISFLMLAMIANSLKNLIGKNLIKPTYPGKQDTHCILRVILFYITYGKNLQDHKIMMTIVNIIIQGRSIEKKSCQRNMSTFPVEEKFEELFMVTKNIDITFMRSLVLISLVGRRKCGPRLSASTLSTSSAINGNMSQILK